MNIDVGKSAKRMGHMHPRDARKIDATKPTHGLGGTVALKNYGYEYEWRFFIRHGWRKRTCWFKTKKSRDQSLENFDKRNKTVAYYRNLRAIER